MAPESLWRLARFRNLWLAQTVSLLGTQVTLLAFPFVALLLHGTALDVSLLSTVEFVPILILGLPAGAWVERLPLRLVMLVADGARALALAVVPITWAAGVLTLPVLFAVAFVWGWARCSSTWPRCPICRSPSPRSNWRTATPSWRGRGRLPSWVVRPSAVS
ncbi:MFS transporter [Streptacidiphilus sp. 4-A2]|nr:MFS transporter [Streptacidiphilus sp. 4-A2]